MILYRCSINNIIKNHLILTEEIWLIVKIVRTKKIFSALLIFLIISALLVFSACVAEFIQMGTGSSMPAISVMSVPETGDIGIVIAFAVCGATAFLTIKLTGNKNKIK